MCTDIVQRVPVVLPLGHQAGRVLSAIETDERYDVGVAEGVPWQDLTEDMLLHRGG